MNRLVEISGKENVNVVIVDEPQLIFSDPTPLGFLGFGISLFMYGGVQLQMYWPDALFMSNLLVIGGFVQFCAGIMHYFKENLYGMTFHFSFGCLFCWMVVQKYLFTKGLVESDSTTNGVYLAMWFAHGFFLFLISMKYKLFHIIQFICLFTEIWLALTIIGSVVEKYYIDSTTSAETVIVSAGICAVITGLLSVYFSGAFLVNLKYGRVMMPYEMDIFNVVKVSKSEKSSESEKKKISSKNGINMLRNIEQMDDDDLEINLDDEIRESQNYMDDEMDIDVMDDDNSEEEYDDMGDSDTDLDTGEETS